MKRSVMIGYTLDEGIKLPVRKTIHVCDTYSKIYDTGIDAIVDLEKAELLLLLYLSKQANELNLIDSGKKTRIGFNDFINRASKRKKLSYADSTIKQAFTGLKKAGFILPTEDQGVFYMNPEYIFRGTEKDRLKRNTLIEGKYLKDLS